MKGLVNTYKGILASVAILISATACTDELNYPGQTVEEGLPATITVNVTLPEMTEITRADIREGLDYQVNSLWIGVYNATSKKRTGSQFVASADFGTTTAHTKNSITEQIEAETGSSYIVAVANYEGRTCSMEGETGLISYEKALEGADTYEKFLSIVANFNDAGEINTAAPVNALLMSGHYIDGSSSHSDGSYTDPDPVAIDDTKITLTGSIHLRRLVSQVKFEVSYDTDNISDFQIISYQVKNVPNQSWLYERNDGTLNGGDTHKIGTTESYQTSNLYTNATSEGTTWKFDWWQFENKRTGKDWVNDYNDRELEYKDKEDGTNTGKYKALLAESKDAESLPSDLSNNNATYLELKVRMTMSKDENGDALKVASRNVEATYTIHLGYVDDAKDFNSLRNSKYTYTVKIENVNSILVEATCEEGETVPGAEGIITDIGSKYVELDAHYGVYNIQLPYAAANQFHYIINCYDEKSDLVTYDSENPSSIDNKYKDWIKIKKADSQTKLAEYKNENDNPLYSLEELKEKGIEAGWYTVFFNEYVYEDENGGTSNWEEYVNKPARQVWLSVKAQISPDKESVKYSSEYTFSQKSIQTFYGSGDTALGMEQVNESYGLNMRNTFNTTSKGTNKVNGRYNTAWYITGSDNSNFVFNENSYEWSKFVTLTKLQEVNAINNTELNIPYVAAQTIDNGNPVALPALVELTGQTNNSYDPDQSSSRKYIEAINACMNRNRDLDGDGKIDKNELRWYVPAVSQLTQMIIGSQSLSEPIMNFKKYDSLKKYTDGNNDVTNNHNMQLFIYGSNGEVIWLMEGLSVSTWTDSKPPLYTEGFPWEVRCVRNLGTNNSTITDKSEVQDAYTINKHYRQVDGANIGKVSMDYYDSKSIRVSKITRMYPHSAADDVWNSVSKAFEYQTTTKNLYSRTTSGSGSNQQTVYYWTGASEQDNRENWVTWLNAVNPCDALNTGEESGWRVPNQKELSILMLNDIVTSETIIYDISATFAYYYEGSAYFTPDAKINLPIMMVRRDGNGVASGCQQPYGDYYLRCVRDVDN